MLQWLLLYILPFGLSSVAAGLTTIWIKQHELGMVPNVLLKWLSENGVFYLLIWLGGKFLPASARVAKEDEGLKQIIAVECLDTFLRLLLFAVSSLVPCYEELITSCGSLFLDLLFLYTVSRSHSLILVVSKLTKFLPTHFELTTLRLAELAT